MLPYDVIMCGVMLQADRARGDILQSVHHRGNMAAMEVCITNVVCMSHCKGVAIVIVYHILIIYIGLWH